METNKFLSYFTEAENRKKTRLGYYALLITLLLLSLLTDVNVKEDKEYGDYDHLVVYIYEYNDLPENYVPKSQQDRVETEELYLYSPFYNREELLPLDDTYTEVYLNAVVGDKGAERLVYSDNGVYYTSDHYESFTLVDTDEVLLPHRIVNIFLIVSLFTYPGIIVILIRRKSLTIDTIKTDFNSDFEEIKISIQNMKDNLDKTKKTEKE